MTYLPEPTTAAEVFARASAVRARASGRVIAIPPPKVDDAALISMAMREAHQFLAELTSTKCAVPQVVRTIVASVAMEHDVPASEIMGRSRNTTVHTARRAAMCRVKEATGASTSVIGKWFDRDHSTVVYAIASNERRQARMARARRWFAAKYTLPEWYPEAMRMATTGVSHAAIGKQFGASKQAIWRMVQKHGSQRMEGKQ